jgi:hypothetical protein
MKRLIIISIFVFSQLLTAQQDIQIDSLDVKMSNDTAYVWDYNAWEQCGFQLDYTVDIHDSIITITQIDTAEDLTACYGYHNFVVPVVGLSEGHYRVDIFRDCLYEDLKFIGSIRFEYLINVVNEGGTTPNEFELLNAYPNPFNPATKISYRMPEDGYVSLKIYNSIGEKVSTLVKGMQTKGYHEVDFTGGELPSGIYYYSIEYNSKMKTKKIMLLR